MKNYHLVKVIALFGTLSSLHANEEAPNPKPKKKDLLEATYTFAKSYANLIYENTITLDDSSTSDTSRISPTFGWGEEGSLLWQHQVNDSGYYFVAKATGMHNSSNYNYNITSASQAVRTPLGGSTLNLNNGIGYYHQRNQFNFFGLDLFFKSDLSKTKHAHFSVYGGAIIAGYNYHRAIHAYISANSGQKYWGKDSITEYLAGPNLKVAIDSPFFKDKLNLSLKVGLGFMMGFVSANNYYKQFNLIDSTTNTKQGAQYANLFRTDWQADIEAAVGFRFRDFTLSGGLNLFFLQSIKPLSTITFGGPFVRGSYLF